MNFQVKHPRPVQSPKEYYIQSTFVSNDFTNCMIYEVWRIGSSHLKQLKPLISHVYISCIYSAHVAC